MLSRMNQAMLKGGHFAEFSRNRRDLHEIGARPDYAQDFCHRSEIRTGGRVFLIEAFSLQLTLRDARKSLYQNQRTGAVQRTFGAKRATVLCLSLSQRHSRDAAFSST